jgi:hypothetical protein
LIDVGTIPAKFFAPPVNAIPMKITTIEAAGAHGLDCSDLACLGRIISDKGTHTTGYLA